MQPVYRKNFLLNNTTISAVLWGRARFRGYLTSDGKTLCDRKLFFQKQVDGAIILKISHYR